MAKASNNPIIFLIVFGLSVEAHYNLNFLFFSVTSSEKVDKENRYSDFTILSLPYPGCEFFKSFKDHNYSAENLVFDWTQVRECSHTSCF